MPGCGWMGMPHQPCGYLVVVDIALVVVDIALPLLSKMPTVTMMLVTDKPHDPIHHVYHGHDRKPCQVQLEDGSWVDAEIRSWDRDTAGRWTATVARTRGPGQSSSLDRFPSERVRSVEGVEAAPRRAGIASASPAVRLRGYGPARSREGEHPVARRRRREHPNG